MHFDSWGEVNLSSKKKPTTMQILDETPDIRIPDHEMKSAMSYLVFNTAENAYSNLVKNDLINPLNQKSKTKKDDEEPVEDIGNDNEHTSSKVLAFFSLKRLILFCSQFGFLLLFFPKRNYEKLQKMEHS